MIDSARLLADLTRLLDSLERDLRQQLAEHDDVRAPLKADYDAARQVERTQDTFETWCEEPITQAAVAWILGGVYYRFLEDNGLIDPMLSGVGARHTRAQQEHQHYFQQHPTHSDRDYLEHVFGQLGALPPTAALFNRTHNPLWRLPLSADAARALVEFWQRLDPDTGQVTHDFTDPAWDTRFLGDLYQDLSAPVRKRYALLQTPRFVESFILDRTLTPAIETFGYRDVRVIDPTCGSGHFLLGAFERLLALAQEHEPSRDVRVLVQDVLSRVAGVDINPYATAIATFRLTVASLLACGITRLSDAPGFDVRVVSADSLLHGPRLAAGEIGAVQTSLLEDTAVNQYYFAEDATRVNSVLGQQYHAVVGNPPYISVDDAALRRLYRARYGSCSGRYTLVVPFVERFFELALSPPPSDAARAGYVGLIVSDSFTKHQFGRKLIEQFIPRWDLTHVVDTSDADIPGHTTPTVILFGRHRMPQADVVRAAMGIRGESSVRQDPSKGPLWLALLEQLDRPGSESLYFSVADLARSTFHQHPWSLGGGGAADLKVLLDGRGITKLKEVARAIGISSVTGEDDLYLLDCEATARRLGVTLTKPVVTGDVIRDWVVTPSQVGVWLYDTDFQLLPLATLEGASKLLWLGRTLIRQRRRFGTPMIERGLSWYEWQELYPDKLRTPLSLIFAAVASHNHFAIDRGGSVFKQSTLVIKLDRAAGENEYLALLGLLNSSTACFWMKQVFYPKSTTTGDISTEKGKPESNRYDFAATPLLEFPLPAVLSDLSLDTVRALARQMSELADDIRALGHAWESSIQYGSAAIRNAILEAASHHERLRGRLIQLQEELDWEVYQLYGLSALGADRSALEGNTQGIRLSDRPFEWLSGPTPTSGVPARFLSRRESLESSRELALMETPVYKRLWLGQQGVYGHASRTFLETCHEALGTWMLRRLEESSVWNRGSIASVQLLADEVSRDHAFGAVAANYAQDEAFDVTALVERLVVGDAVPFLSVMRYRESGLVKRRQWERTWDLQREEDAGVSAVEIPLPPRYKDSDFKAALFWRLRGKLDVPKERFITYPGCERAADGSLPIAWAGWNHAERARALGAYYMQIKNEEGTVPTKLVPLLAGLLELLPWVRQWHPGTDPEFGLNLGEYYASFVDTEARALGLTADQVRAWQPEAAPRRGRRRRAEGN